MLIDNFKARSREAFARILQPLMQADAYQSQTIAQELFSILDLLSQKRNFLSLTSEPNLTSDQRKKVIRAVLLSKVNTVTADIVSTAIAEEWSNSSDMITGLRQVANYAQMRKAELLGELPQVRSELLFLVELMNSAPLIEENLTNLTIPLSARKNWLKAFLEGKVLNSTLFLVIQNFAYGLPGNVFLNLAEITAQLDNLKIAHITAACPLTEKQRTEITAKLSKIYQSPIVLSTTIDRAILGGVIIRVGYDILDSSIAGKITQALNAV